MSKALSALGRAALYILLYVAVQLLVTTAFVFFGAISYFLSGQGSLGAMDLMQYILQFSNETLAENMLISSIVTLAAFALVALVRKNNLRARFSLQPPAEKTSLIAAVPFGIAANLLVGFIVSLLPSPLFESYDSASSSLSGLEINVVYVLSVVLLAPLVEEILFRGLIQSTLKRGMRLEYAVLLQALFFALIHTGIVWMIYAFILGLSFGILRENQRSLWPCVVLHCSFNFTNVLLGLIPYDFFDAWPLLYVLLLMASAVICILLGYGLFIHTPAAPAATPLPETEIFPRTEPETEATTPQSDDQYGGN